MTNDLKTTAESSLPIWGDKKYQIRAREAFPILVRQAVAGNPIYYSELANELGMPNPRNLNYVLGSIGQTVQEISSKHKMAIPPIQCLVINLNDGLPGEGIGWFLERGGNSGYDIDDYTKLTKSEQRDVVLREYVRIYSFARWHEVLSLAGLEPFHGTTLLPTLSRYMGSSESQHHKALKQQIFDNPSLAGIRGGDQRKISGIRAEVRRRD